MKNSNRGLFYHSISLKKFQDDEISTLTPKNFKLKCSSLGKICQATEYKEETDITKRPYHLHMQILKKVHTRTPMP